ncbi:hypothetical protein FOA52_005846 [Chlamydomonas sp. UWO 241]|nr:hypothetical protein FOA52_005846 [Chlamydomonas sp. UWO 241]
MAFAKSSMALAVMLIFAFAGMADATRSLNEGRSLSAHGYPNKYTAYLKGKNQVPAPIMTKTWGSAAFEWNATTALVTVQVAQGVDIWAGHIHDGAAGTAGPVVVTLFSFTDPVNGGLQYISGSFSTTLMLDLNAFPGLIEMITSGDAYVNVHSKINAGGEIRDQLTSSA